MNDAVIVAAARSPIGRAYKGGLAGTRPDDLAATIVEATLAQVPQLDPHEIDDLTVGCATPGGEQGFNLGRIVAGLVGLDDVPGTTITRYCASSVQTTRMAFHAIRAGEGDVFVSAGVESVSSYVKGNSDRIPNTRNPRFDQPMERSHRRAEAGAAWTNARDVGELPDYYVGMGNTAENVARLRGVSRAAQDEFAALSQQRYERARAAGFWAREITPVTVADGTTLTDDESPRPHTTVEKLGELAPAFQETGTVTAGNACPLSDGAAALVVMSDRRAHELDIEPIARIVSTGLSALDPELMGLGPVEASRRALSRAGMAITDIDLVEMNEAFAAQVLPSADDLDIDIDRLNVHGGAIALGHPFGMTGARTTGTLINGLRATDGTIGLQTMCVGGGQGMALVLERLS